MLNKAEGTLGHTPSSKEFAELVRKKRELGHKLSPDEIENIQPHIIQALESALIPGGKPRKSAMKCKAKKCRLLVSFLQRENHVHEIASSSDAGITNRSVFINSRRFLL